jgi:hypothetical protein
MLESGDLRALLVMIILITAALDSNKEEAARSVTIAHSASCLAKAYGYLWSQVLIETCFPTGREWISPCLSHD